MFENPNKKARSSHIASRKDFLLKNLKPVESAAALLKIKGRLPLLEGIYDQAGFDSETYDLLVLPLLHSLSKHCQHLPETANHYYSDPGGLLDHALNRTEAAMRLFRQFIVLDEEGTLSKEQMIWTYALLSAALLQGIGKLYLDFKIEIFDQEKNLVKEWSAVTESLGKPGQFYHYEFQQDRVEEFRKHVSVLLAYFLMPEAGMSLIASSPEILEVWLALLHEDYSGAGTLGAILIRAEDIALQEYWNQFLIKNKHLLPSNHSSIMVNPKLAINSAAASKDSVVEKEQKEQLVGAAFIKWLRQELASGQIILNKWPLFIIWGGMLMLPEVFAMFVRSHSEYKNWEFVRKGFLALGLHGHLTPAQHQSGQDFTLSDEDLKSALMIEPMLALPDSMQVYDAVTQQELSVSALECVQLSLLNRSANHQPIALAERGIQLLSSSGQWMDRTEMAANGNDLKLGQRG